MQALLFDLDDTLLDTSGLLVPAAHREAAEAMVRAGLSASVEQVFSARVELAAQNPREDVNRLVAARYGCARQEVIEAGRTAFYHRDVGPLSLEPRVAALLTGLKARYRLFLVTIGSIKTQRAKVAALGLEPYFEAIYYLDHLGPMTKEDVFRQIVKEHGLEVSRCVVIGDRPDSEIAAGNRLGMWTVRLARGEHRRSRPLTAVERATREIESLAELEPALEAVTSLEGLRCPAD